MAITISLYNNANAVTKSVEVDFLLNVLASEYKSNVSSDSSVYHFKFSPTGTVKDTDNVNVKKEINVALSDLVLNGAKQSASDDANAYSNITTMIADYIYDMVKGHTANQYTSGCSRKAPMKFT